MKRQTILMTAVLVVGASVHAQPLLIVGDNYNVTGSGTGFGATTGVNTLIGTRLTGSEATGMRYLLTDPTKAATAYSITGSKLQVNAAASSGRFSLTKDGTTPFNFGPTFGVSSVYEIGVSLGNTAAGIQRMSFGFGTAEANVTLWDFGIQLHRAVAGDTFYTISKRIDLASSGLSLDSNAAIATTAPGTFGSEINFLIRVTDAGAESSTFSSRVQVSLDGGSTFFYDTQADSELINGWRFDGSARYISWDIAASAAAKYDNLSITLIPEPAVDSLAAAGCWLLLLCLMKTHRK